MAIKESNLEKLV